ncbi:MAG: fibrobacter succinogenes major paralogous domain-containing protein [Fibrobacter sp.]|uniref:fibrobacter succinogenes major paralogous domain-containing protein n=1 Tax=Fibrobacter sp. TaxID=35828 RepID=UPI0025C285CD|nr:fibrobacter succinogenes major paralogous domain-containing protein [Fibrobacter sp.]MBQ7081402.1 fibrobacter succinogenes major paralogous domain-containing protein [Fibrobacter sp.]
MKKLISKSFTLWMAIVSAGMFAACSEDKVAGGITEDAGLAIKNLDVAGVSQKGPFVKGASVKVQGIDCKTMKFKEEIFEGSVKNDMGEFVVENVNLSTTCAVVEVTGEYRSEMTGKKVSDKLTLRALTNLKDRTHVNVNLLTNLEYERVMYYVTEKGKTFDEAKDLAESEVLAAFGMAGESTEFENLDIFGTSDADATLLAISVLMQGDADVKTLTERLDKFNESFAESGKWNDDDTKKAIADWIANAVAKAVMDSIRKNMENWGFAKEVPDFEKVIEKFGTDSTMTDSRDGKVYRTIKIGNQVWMAENLNFKTDGSYCYNDSAKYCTKYGRLYSWSAANKACPDGWHLPTIDEFKTLFTAVGGQSTAANNLKSASVWNNDGNGKDDYSFTALPAGIRYSKGNYKYVGDHANFWSSIEYSSDSASYVNLYYDYDNARLLDHDKGDGMSVRCVMGEPVAASSSSSAKLSSSSVDADGWSWDVSKEARFNPNIKYDSIIDPRDKQVYKVVKIEVKDKNYSQVWMAENLNYADSVKTPSLKGQNWCYNNDEKNCKVSGRYYTWAAAIDSVALANDSKNPLNCGYGKTCGINRGVQGICPDGWHLPTLHEWGLLSVALGNAGVSGDSLKALTGWDYAGTADNNGVDAYGFAALPTGRMVSTSSWSNVGSNVYYWSSEEDGTYEAQYSNINNIYTKFYLFQGSKKYGQSVRCIKGDPSTAAIKSSSSSSVGETKSSSSSAKSSSSVVVSSSSQVKMSSSSVVPDGWSWDVPKEARFNPNIKYDSMIDPRDKRVYKVVKIEVKERDYSKVWMAENLNYSDSVKTPSLKGKSWCYRDSAKYCEVSGRYYTWAAAIDSVALASDTVAALDCGYGKTCELGERRIQGICPDGWHLPNRDEWGWLSVYLGNAGVAGDTLKALTGWDYAGTENNNGVDAYGFTALPTGRRVSETSWRNIGSDVYYWTSQEEDAYEAQYSNMNNQYTKFYLYQGSKTYGQSVRCVKDE